MIEPTADAKWVNGVLNHPAVRPWIADMGEGAIDAGAMLARPNVLALRGEHGVFLVFRLDTGIWEVHTAILPGGRGGWARAFGKAGASWMMTRTDCVEILTRVPATHAAARALTLDMGFRLQFATLPTTAFRGEMVPIEVFSLSLQDWANSVETAEIEGCAFHQWLNEQVGGERGRPHENDPAHNRVVGVALAMMRGGQLLKAVVWYNRWAVAARHPMIAAVCANPLVIRFDAGYLQMDADGTISYLASN